MTIQIRQNLAYALGLGAVVIVLSTAFDTHAAQKFEQIGLWAYYSKINDFDDTTTYGTFVFDENKQDNVSLHIKCTPGKTKVHMLYRPGQFMGILTHEQDSEVRYRIDNTPTITEDWRISEEGIINLYKSQAATMINRMMGGRRLVIQAHDYDFKPVKHTFGIYGADKALSKLLRDCGLQQPAKYQHQNPLAIPYEQPSKPQVRRPISGSTTGMSLEDILGQ